MDEAIRAYLSDIGRRGVAARRREDRPCLMCGTMMRAAIRKRRYCSAACMARAYRARKQQHAGE